MEELSPYDLHVLEVNSTVSGVMLVALIVTIFLSAKKGGIREVVENTFLWFLLFMGVAKIATLPISEDDEITGAIFFVAFGLCRIAKHMASSKQS